MKRPSTLTKIIGKRVYIKLPTLKDAKKILEFTQDEELKKYVTWKSPKSLKEAKLFVENRRLAAAKGKKFLGGIYFKNNNELIGSAGYIKFDDDENSVELGYWIAKPFQRKGFARECVNLLINYATFTLRAREIVITCTKENIASKKLAESLDFHLYQILKRHVKIQGKHVDRCRYKRSLVA